MKRYSKPITEENFPKASEYILKLYRISKGKNRAYNIVVPLSTIIFVFLSAIFTYGAIYSFSTAEDAIIFEKLKPVTDIWLFFSNILMQEGLAWYYNLLIFVAALLLGHAFISLVISVIFTLCAKMPEIPQTAITEKDKASALHGILTKETKKIFIDEEVLGWICTAVYIALMVAFTVYSLILTFDASDLSDLFSLVIGALFVFVILAFVYYGLYIAFYHMNTFACNGKSLFSYRNDVYDYWCSVDPEEAERNEKRKKEEEAKKAAAARNSVSSYAGMAYYEEAKKKAISNIQRYTYGSNYSEYELSGIHLDDKEALRQFLSSTAPDDAKEAAIKKYNDYHLDYYID